MTDQELADLDRTHLSQSQQTAMKLVESAKDGNSCGVERLARYVADRELGRPTELHVVDSLDTEIRKAMGWFASRSQPQGN